MALPIPSSAIVPPLEARAPREASIGERRSDRLPGNLKTSHMMLVHRSTGGRGHGRVGAAHGSNPPPLPVATRVGALCGPWPTEAETRWRTSRGAWMTGRPSRRCDLGSREFTARGLRTPVSVCPASYYAPSRRRGASRAANRCRPSYAASMPAPFLLEGREGALRRGVIQAAAAPCSFMRARHERSQDARVHGTRHVLGFPPARGLPTRSFAGAPALSRRPTAPPAAARLGRGSGQSRSRRV